MYVGQIQFSTQETYSPWMPRQSNGVKVIFEVLGGGGTDGNTPTLTVAMATKNNEEIGDGALISGASAASGVGFGTITIAPTEGTNGMKELIRFKMTLPAPMEDQMNWVHYRILTPVWYDKA